MFFISNHLFADVKVAEFSKLKPNTTLEGGWEPLTFESIETKTAYFVVTDENKSVVKAISNSSASGMVLRKKLDVYKTPILRWQWKIDNVITKADLKTKEGDDYPARIYVTFDFDKDKLSTFERFKVGLYETFYGETPPLAVLNYVWDNKYPVNTISDNAYTDRVKMIVVRSGASSVSQWMSEQRNILEDYKKAFGEPPSSISGIAIMTDTDNTGSAATAYYGDITFSAK